jgi:hypothetical protein
MMSSIRMLPTVSGSALDLFVLQNRICRIFLALGKDNLSGRDMRGGLKTNATTLFVARVVGLQLSPSWLFNRQLALGRRPSRVRPPLREFRWIPSKRLNRYRILGLIRSSSLSVTCRGAKERAPSPSYGFESLPSNDKKTGKGRRARLWSGSRGNVG